jgi:hypothetical protein
MSEEAARQEAARRDFQWEVFLASDGVNSIRPSGMTHADAFVAGAMWQATQPVVVTAEQAAARVHQRFEHSILTTHECDVVRDWLLGLTEEVDHG